METVLYRKYRPQNFKEVIGQENIVKVLEGSIKLNRISHAYIFAGSRGTGKTSIARIFAKEIGCKASDIYEIDAASNTGVDDVRLLNESVSTLPFESPYKIYILDEVHMLSKSAFNALLKTLEEPPSHVVFILATTELNKLPETVVSRCQLFTFQKPNHNVLKELVVKVAKKEGFSIEQSSADLIALLGDGSFRDTYGILQKVVSYSADKKISAEEVLEVTGSPKNEIVNDFISAIEEGSAEKGIEAVNKASKANVDMKVYLKLILRKLRQAMLLKFAPEMEKQIKNEVSDSDFEFLKKLSAKKDSKINSATLLVLLEAYDLAGRAYLPELSLELSIIKLTDQKQ
ncbi:MAG: DNA polymerase III subunit gamma/tau [Candidatus Paceibacterota bacterium]|jgi:DNA polymerase-3 subunit gamma/tau